MANKKPILLPKVKRELEGLGENLRLARLRRKLSTTKIAERAGISRSTLLAIEKGQEGVSIGFYFNVLHVLGLYEEFKKVALDDELGRKLQDAEITVKKRAPKRKDDLV